MALRPRSSFWHVDQLDGEFFLSELELVLLLGMWVTKKVNVIDKFLCWGQFVALSIFMILGVLSLV